jgi:hypothetical protein
MENSFQTSFIPKKPMVSSSSDREPRSLFLWITTLLLIISVAASVILFVYKIYLTKQKESSSASLLIARDSFEKDTIDELELFDKRTEGAKQILSNHVVFSPMFALLGDITIPSIQYTNFNEQTTDKGHLINMEGLARDYRSIALQADMFNSVKGRSFSNVLFSNLVKDKNNNISFNLKFNVEPDLLSYEKNVLNEQGGLNRTQ